MTEGGEAAPAPGLRTELLAAIEPLADQWESLADRAGAPPFLRPGWFIAWQKGFDQKPLQILTARAGRRLVGVLPLYRRGGVLRSATNEHTPMFAPLAEYPEALDALAVRLFELGARRTSLFFLGSNDAGTRAIREAAAAGGFRSLEQPLQSSPYIRLTDGFAEYEANLESKLRSELRRRRRRLEERGPLELDVSDGGEALEARLEEGFEIEAASWKGAAGTAIASSASTRRFYRELASWAAQQGLLRLAFLRHDGRPLAFDFCLETERCHYLLKTGYDPAQRKIAPGIIMRREMIERAFALGIERYEFLGDANEWKLRWTSATHERVVFRAFSPAPGGVANWVAAAHVRPLAKRLLRRS
jgi:CelD/BcsL family acetyltransferase involved in cellulose biosynthesis